MREGGEGVFDRAVKGLPGAQARVRTMETMFKEAGARAAVTQAPPEINQPGALLSLVKEPPGRVVRAVASSFYRDLRQAGLGPCQVIAVIAAMLAEINEELRRSAMPPAGMKRGPTPTARS